MIADLVLLALAAALLRRLLFAHLALVNEGSTDPGSPFEITDVGLAQALYGRLADGEVDHYQFYASPGTKGRFLLLIPNASYNRDFRATVRVRGPGLGQGLLLAPMGDRPMRIAGTDYRLCGMAQPGLAGGSYAIEVAGVREGVYCLTVGDREGGQADEATRARVKALLADA